MTHPDGTRDRRLFPPVHCSGRATSARASYRASVVRNYQWASTNALVMAPAPSSMGREQAVWKGASIHCICEFPQSSRRSRLRSCARGRARSWALLPNIAIRFQFPLHLFTPTRASFKFSSSVFHYRTAKS